LAASAFAQEPVAASTVPSKDEVLQFMNLMHLRASMEQLIEGLKKSMRTGAEAGFKQKIPGATPEQLAKLNSVTDAVFQDFPLDEIIDAMVPIYQKHLSKSDLEAVIAFYSSPVGQKLLKEQPAMMAEGMQAGQDIMMRKLPEMQERLKTKVAQLAEDELQGSSPNKKQSQ
ncbi:MAG: DUF2059 domain-containing protein, partial [Terriglobales bacterium]